MTEPTRDQPIEIRTVDPAGDDARQCVEAYFDELSDRSGALFDPASGISAEPAELTPPAGRFVIAYRGTEPLGCGAVKHRAGEASQIKRMWVSAGARGLGIGRRLLEALEDDVRASGQQRVHLETNDLLVEAIGLYRKAGYAEVAAFNDEPFADHWFEKRLS